jgi:tetraacyldisaccharide 4'-kinase
MIGPTEFRDLVSSRRQGFLPTALRLLLRVAEVPYTAVVSRRNRRYDRGRAEIRHVSVPVISVGNLSLGGTGKTPMVKWLAGWLQRHGTQVAIVSRGYGAAIGKHNDEALELALALPTVPHLQNRNRVAAAERAIAESNSQVLVLDDGFQHRRLAREIDIVLLDALEPFGFEHVFPRGTLREPLSGLDRAHVVCLSRADAVSARERDAIRRRVAKLAPNAIWCELAHHASSLVNSSGDILSIESLAGKRVAAVCGIGNPAGFRHTLVSTGAEICQWCEFPDHHSYTPADLESIQRAATEKKVELIVCTRKDLVKICQNQLGELALWAVAIEMRFLTGQDELEQLLKRVVPSA